MNKKAREEVLYKMREDEIIKTTLELMEKDNWLGLTIDQIASKAQVSKSTIYKHFKSKDEIFAVISLNNQERIIDELESIDLNGNVIEVFRTIIGTYFKFNDLPVQYQRVFSMSDRCDFWPGMSEHILNRFQDYQQRSIKIHSSVMLRAIEEGAFKKQPIEVAMVIVTSIVVGFIRLMWNNQIPLDPVLREELISKVLDAAIAGLK